MLNTTPGEHCQLCGCTVERDPSHHLRAVHQVAAGERTVADVPVGRVDWMRIVLSDEPRQPRSVVAV